MNRVAIITRTKDRPVFLHRALQSVQAQTFSDYIHVIVNDGGDKSQVDRAVEALSDVQRSRTMVHHRDRSSNAPDTIFNESIDRVESELVVIHDDDDTWHREFLQRTVDALDSDSSLAGVVVRTEKVTESIEGDVITQLKREPYMPDVRAISLYRQCIDNQLTPIATLFRRSAYEAVGKFDDTLPVVGDWEFGIRLLLRYDIGYVDPGFALASYHHRKDGGNSFTGHDHRANITKVHNKYLRDDLAKGNMGVGYIMNDLRYQQDLMAAIVRKLMPRFASRLIRNKMR